MQETRGSRVQSLGGEDALDEGMTSHSSILAWRISWTEEPGGLRSMGRKQSDTTEAHICPMVSEGSLFSTSSAALIACRFCWYPFQLVCGGNSLQV